MYFYAVSLHTKFKLLLLLSPIVLNISDAYLCDPHVLCKNGKEMK